MNVGEVKLEPALRKKKAMSDGIKHRLKHGTLSLEDEGVIGRCVCGWTTGFRFSSFIASVAFRDHLDTHKAEMGDAVGQ